MQGRDLLLHHPPWPQRDRRSHPTSRAVARSFDGVSCAALDLSGWERGHRGPRSRALPSVQATLTWS